MNTSTEIVGICWHCGAGRHNDCLEPLAERVLDKTRANFREHFEPRRALATVGAAPPPEDLARAAQDLFR